MTADEEDVIEDNAKSTLESFAGWIGEQMEEGDNKDEEDTDSNDTADVDGG